MSKFLDSSGLLKLLNLLKDNTIEASTIELANVATSGLYSDLLNQPTIIPEAPSDDKSYARKNGGWVEVDTSSGSTTYLPFVDSYTANCNTWFTNGYTKVSQTATINQPSLCTGADKWGVLFFIAENASMKTGTQMYFPIDGTYKGRIFYRSSKSGTFGNWMLIPLKTSELTNDSNFVTTDDLSDYLPLSGGELTGSLTVGNTFISKISGTGDSASGGSLDIESGDASNPGTINISVGDPGALNLNTKVVLRSQTIYGTDDPSLLTNPTEGQIYFKITS